MKTKRPSVLSRVILATLVATAAIGVAQGAKIAEYLFAGGSDASTGLLGSTIGLGADIVNGAGSTPFFNGDRLEIQGVDTKGAFVQASTYAVAEATWINRNTWVIFTVTAPAGQKIDLTSLTFDYTEIQPAFFLLGVYTSKTGFTAGAQLQGFYRAGNSSTTFTNRNGTSIDLTGMPELQNITDSVEFRFLVGDDSGAATRIHVLDNIVLNGEVVTIPDPNLVVDLANSPAPNFNFGNVFGNESRKMTFVCKTAGGAGTVSINNLAISDNAGGGLFTLGAVTYSDTANQPVLSAGDSVTIEVIANNSQSGNFNGQLAIDTTSAGGTSGAETNDLVLPLNSTTIANQALLNQNPLMTGGLGGWSGNAAFVTPGIAPGSTGMARVRGAGDPGGAVANGGSLYQTALPDGFSDFQFTAYFTPIQSSKFAGYVDPAGTFGITGPVGVLTDRTFQWVLLGSDVSPPNPAFGDTQAANTLINLAYMPAGIAPGGTPDFYVFDGDAASWVATGIGAIAGSIDNDTDGDSNLNGVGDGRLDTASDPADVINVYRMVVTGKGLGTASASYGITVNKVSGPDSFTSGSASGLTAFHGLDGTSHTATAHAFITSDTSANSNSEKGYRTPFWVDDAPIFNGSAPDPGLTVLSTPSIVLVTPPATTGTTSFLIRNDGPTTSLNVSSIDTGTSGFSVTSATSFSLAPSAVAQVDVAWNSAASTYTPVYETAVLTINSSNHAPVVVNLTAGLMVDFPTALNNGNFETPGTDNVSDADTFAAWDETANPTAVTDVPGLIAPSITAAALAPGTSSQFVMAQNLTSPPLINFTVDLDFAVPKVGRDLYLFLEAAGTGSSRANIGYNSAVNSFIAFQGTLSGSGTFYNVLPITLTANTPYKLRILGNKWGFADAAVTLEVFDAGGVSLGKSAPFAYFQGDAPVGGLGRLAFTTAFGSSGGVTLDEVSLSGQGIDTSPPPGFSSWISGTFTNGAVPLLQQGANDDPDNDGISNLVEYAIAGQDPTVGNPSISTFSGGTLSFTKRDGASGLSYAIQDSTDLGITDAWAEVTAVPPAYVNDDATISYTMTPGNPAKNFVRLRVLSN